MRRGSDARWNATLGTASRLLPAEEWRTSIAASLQEAAGAEFVTVVTCPPGDWGAHFQMTTYPFDYADLMVQVRDSFLPRIERLGEGFRDAVARHGLVYAPLEVARNRPIAEEMRETLLAPADLEGWVVTSIVDGAGELLGALAVGGRSRSETMLEEAGARLVDVSRIAARTLEGALQLAAGCQARATAPRLCLEVLSRRERQIAALAADGLRNANVAARLDIAEATVAVHLKRIYGKLGVASRVELATRWRG